MNIREYTQNKMNSDKIEATESKFSLSHKLLLFFPENLSFTIIQNKVFFVSTGDITYFSWLEFAIDL